MVLRAGLALSELDLAELWAAQAGLGGMLTRDEIEATLCGMREPTAYEHDLLAQALNDHFTERGQNHPVAYSDGLDDPVLPPNGSGA